MQAGARRQPAQLPAQHQAKPGSEADLALAPRFLAPDYRGSGKLEGFAAIVTGGDSGIGRAVAVLFAREGADVAIVYLDASRRARRRRRGVEAEGRRCLLIAGDVKDPKFCDARRRQGRQGLRPARRARQQRRLPAARRVARGPHRRAPRPHLPHQHPRLLPHGAGGAAAHEGGRIDHQHRLGHRPEGQPELLDYSSTKGAIHAFTKALAQNVIDRGIRVNAVAPGPVWTPLNPADAPAEKVAEFGSDTQMKRAAQPEELSPAFVFLASPVCSGYITGIVLPVTGSVGAI